MDGVLLQLLADTRGDPGGWFWPCFEPLRKEFDRHYWVIDCQPWMGAPAGFHDEKGHSDAVVEDRRLNEEQLQLWRPKSIEGWAEHFAEEFLDLWAVQPSADPVEVAAQYGRCPYRRTEAFVEEHAAIRLCYTDSTCWEVFAKDRGLLDAAVRHTSSNRSIRSYWTDSQNRRSGFSQIGWTNWPG